MSDSFVRTVLMFLQLIEYCAILFGLSFVAFVISLNLDCMQWRRSWPHPLANFLGKFG